MSQFDSEIETWENYLVPAGRSIYDGVIADSAVERRLAGGDVRKFVVGLEQRDDVRLFVKLPPWFTVPTPVGEYNPDWAIVMEDRDAHGNVNGRPLLYLVRETKSTHDLDTLRPDERRKIECGKVAFNQALGVSYRVVTGATELP
jgi:type III restriction enzyme